METLRLGLIVTVIPFTMIFLFTTIAWALADLSLRKLPSWKTVMWSLVIILFPPFGALLYNSKVRVPDNLRHYRASLAN
jgi:hypothetical protein